MKTIVLTGATGYLGSNLAKRLCLEYNVICLKRPSSQITKLSEILNKITLVDEIADLPKSVDIVMHCATNYGRVDRSLTKMIESNLTLPVSLLEHFSNVCSFINIDTVLPKFLNSYSLSKSQFVEWGKEFIKDKKSNFFNVKLHQMLGAFDDPSKFYYRLIKECLNNTPYLPMTKAEQKRDFILIDDVVDGILAILRHSGRLQGFYEFELGTGQSITLKEFAETVKKITESTISFGFGEVDYRPGELINLEANIKNLNELQWVPKYNLEQMIKKIVAMEMA